MKKKKKKKKMKKMKKKTIAETLLRPAVLRLHVSRFVAAENKGISAAEWRSCSYTFDT